MRHQSRALFIVLFLSLGLVISTHCNLMWNQRQWNKDLLTTVEPAMYYFESFQCITGIFILSSLCFLVSAVFINSTKQMKMSFFCQHTITFVYVFIMGVVLFSLYPSLRREEAVLENAMSDYGKDDSMTKMMDTIQIEMECCGVTGMSDWNKIKATYPGVIRITDRKQFNATYLNQSISSDSAHKALARVPVTCATMNETHLQFHARGCLVPIFSYKEHIAYSFFVNILLFALYEVAILSLVGDILFIDYEEPDKVVSASLPDCIIISFEEPDAVSNTESKQDEEFPANLLGAWI